MKAACLSLAMMSCALLIDGTSYAFSPGPASQDSTESSTKPLNGNHTTATASAHDGERQKNGTRSDEQGPRRRTSNKNHTHSQANLINGNRPKQLRNGRERSASDRITSVGQPSSSKAAVGAAKIANKHNLPVRRAGIDALGGQQFKNFHNRGATPATVGGPPNSTRNTAAISGTSVNRRRSN